MKRILLVPLILLIFSSLHADNINIVAGPYLPEMKTSATLNGKPISYEDFYGPNGSYMILAHVDYSLFNTLGELALYLEAGFFMDRGRTLIESDTGDYIPSGEDLTMYLVPINAGLTYYFNYLENQILVPFIEGGGGYWLYDEKKERDGSTSGGKYGYFYGAGIKFLMDILEPSAAISMKVDYGIEHTYLILGYRFYTIDKPRGFDFSDDSWFLGLSFSYF